MRGFTRLVPALAAAGVLVAIAGCERTLRPVEANAPPPTGVRVVAVRAQQLAPEIESFGTISYRSKAAISATVEGTAVALAVDEGDRVRPGQLLAQLENVQLTIAKSQAESQLRSAEATLELAKARLADGGREIEARLLSLKRTRLELEQRRREAEEAALTLDGREKLFKIDGISEEQLRSLRLQAQSAQTAYEGLRSQYAAESIGLRDEDLRAAGLTVPSDDEQRMTLLAEINLRTLKAQLDAATAGLEAARSDLQAASLLLESLTIRSPVSGVVGVRQAGIGERVRAADQLFTIIEDAQVYAVFSVAEKQAPRLSCGMPVEVTVPALGNRRFPTSVSMISPLLDPISGNLTVRALIRNEDGSLRPGLFIRARVRTGESRRVIPVPESALVRREGREAAVFVVRDGRAFKRTIVLEPELGGESAGRLAAVGGIEEGERIVDEPPPELKEGGEVYVQG